ncbi:MAG TPA: PDDEXK nuclease domain-containing protein [bacterium]|nr:PDDEXK nuclease domain-containing protein [bacterium]
MNFNQLSDIIGKTHLYLQNNAVKAINRNLTVRNWLIGYYIVEFEQNGDDRAAYGESLLKVLEKRMNDSGLNETLFYWSRKFYISYPSVGNLISATLSQILKELPGEISATVSQRLVIRTGGSISETDQYHTDPQKLISALSFSHIKEILVIEDPLKRLFYENESIKCSWSVRELRRQINTQLYERCGMSKSPESVIEKIKNAEYITAADTVKQPFAFEFLGLKSSDTIDEKDLEQSLINHLQNFLLELGYGFCFEARQKRILIDDEYYFADLVFYHRILHCNVIIELKNDEFRHEHLGQLNAYVSYYRENEMNPGDNLPIGILLCTRKGKKMVEYAIAGMDNKLFVSQYMLQLPDRKELERFILKEKERIE